MRVAALDTFLFMTSHRFGTAVGNSSQGLIMTGKKSFPMGLSIQGLKLARVSLTVGIGKILKDPT